MSRYRYILLYKPYGVLCQFTNPDGRHRTLADVLQVPKDVYPVGRLDTDSEGLLLLTNDKSVNAQLLNPDQAHPRTYWIQVEGAPSNADLEPLRNGVTISINGKPHHTLPARARVLPATPALPERDPPIRFRKSIPDTWIELVLTEGKNRQVRRMTAAIGFPTLRLVRVAIGEYRLDGMKPGEWREVK
jgi:23S rRNA pseudouridine2457 synthase